MRELKAPQQEEFGNIAKAQFVTEPTQQHLEHDISGHFSEVKGSTCPFIAGAATILTAKHGITQICGALQAGSTG
jgi:hypothetical protein